MGIEVLGPLSIDGAARGIARRDRVVLAALVAQRGEPVSPDALADALWGESPPPSAAKIIQGCVVRLRKVLEPEAIETHPAGYRLVVAEDRVDAHHFTRLTERARELMALGEPERAGYALDEGLALWRGQALSDLADWEVGRVEAARLEAERLEAEELRLDAALRAGRHAAVLAEADRLARRQPLRERRWSLLALAQYRCGRQAEALATLRRVRAVLRDELGLDPGPELVELEQSILAQDATLLGPTEPPEPSATCPYLGLVPYDEGDADSFFGREAEAEACMRRLGQARVLAVVGPSGGGKSSLMRAGVVASLRRDGRRVVIVTPGQHPLSTLTALPKRGRPPVLVVDQCEEVFTVCEDPTERSEFLSALVRHSESAPLIVGLRADRLGDLTVHPGFAHLVESGLYLLTAMDEPGLRSAIEGPARQAGLLMEPGLVDLLVREVEGEPGALPLLSHALQAAWAHREGRTLTVAGYASTGGIRGAVAHSAEQMYGQLTPDQRASLRQILLRLVFTGEEGEAVRTRMPRRQVSGDADHDRLIETLVRARLVTSDDGVVELAHEALVRAWPRLRSWLDDDSEGQRVLRHLATAADGWEAMDRPVSELYRGGRLVRALEWRDRVKAELTPTEVAFLSASEQQAMEEEQLAASRARRERRINRRLRLTLVGLALVVLALVFASVAVVRQSDRAQRLADTAVAGRVSAQALLEEQPDRALLMAVAALRIDDTAESRANLLELLSRQPQLAGATRGVGGSFFNAEVSPDGSALAAYDDRNTVYLYDPQTLSVQDTYDTNRAGVEEDNYAPTQPLAFSPDGETLAVGTTNLHPVPIHLLDTTTYERMPIRLGGMPNGRKMVGSLDYSAAANVLVATFDVYVGSSDQAQWYIAVWDTDDPSTPLRTIQLPTSYGVALSPDGSELYVKRKRQDGTNVVTVYATRGSGTREVPAPRGDGLLLTPDGQRLVSPQANGVIVYDAHGGRVTHRLRGGSEVVRRVTLSADGALVAASFDDESVRVWDITSGRLVEQLDVGSQNLWAVAFGPDNDLLYTAGNDRDIRIWDLGGTQRFLPRVVVDEPQGLFDRAAFTAALPSPDGRGVLYIWNGPEGAMLSLLDLRTGARTGTIDTGHVEYGSGAWSSSGDQVATTGADGAVRTWNPVTGRLLKERTVSDSHLSGIAFVPPGDQIVVGNREGELYTLDAETLRRTGPVTKIGDAQRVANVFGASAGRSVLALTGAQFPDVAITAFPPDRGWAVWNVDSGELRRGTLPLHASTAGALSPDGVHIAVGGFLGELVIVDTVTGEPVRAPAQGHESLIGWVAYSPDGKLVLSGASDGTVSLWDAQTARLLGTVRSDVGAAWPQPLPDGRTVLIATYDGQVFRWETDPESWVATACAIARRDLTEQEWSEAFGDRPYEPVCP